MDVIRIVLADDQELFVQSLKSVLEMRAHDIKVVGVAHDGKEAIEFVHSEHPDIVLMDVRMPNMDGVEATRILSQEAPEVRIVMLTTFDDDKYVHSALSYGAVGYLLKSIPPHELIASVRAVQSGAVLISPSVIGDMVDQIVTIDGQKQDLTEESERLLNLIKSLSRREKEVLPLLLQACSNKEIAEQLYIAEQTAKNHISTIYIKLGVHDRVHLLSILRGVNVQDALSSKPDL